VAVVSCGRFDVCFLFNWHCSCRSGEPIPLEPGVGGGDEEALIGHSNPPHKQVIAQVSRGLLPSLILTGLS
jgi:hypothetical protein